MYKILITTALSQELKIIKNKVKNLNIKNIKIDFFSTWTWNYKTILNLTKHLCNNKYSFVVNIWICWYNKKEKNIQVARIFNIQNKKELIVPIPFIFENLDSIACSENIIYKNIWKLDEQFIDMESYWFELVVDNFKIPRIILKVAYDKIWSKETTNISLKKIKQKIESIDYKKLLNEIIIFLDKYKPEEIEFEKYFYHYRLTFSEKIIFKKLYFKYESLTWKSFNDFFKDNKNLDKKEFINLLQSSQ